MKIKVTADYLHVVPVVNKQKGAIILTKNRFTTCEVLQDGSGSGLSGKHIVAASDNIIQANDQKFIHIDHVELVCEPNQTIK